MVTEDESSVLSLPLAGTREHSGCVPVSEAVGGGELALTCFLIPFQLRRMQEMLQKIQRQMKDSR